MGGAPEEPVEQVQEPEEAPVYCPIYLDGEAALTLEFEFYDGVCYVTVESLATALCSEAMVEEENGAVAVTASAVTEVVDVVVPEEAEPAADAAAPEEAEAPLEPETAPEEEAGLGEGTQPVEADEPAAADMEAEEPTAANVEEEVLFLSARAGDKYLVANGRYLYAPDGIILTAGGKVAAPVRVLSRVFNLAVDYDGVRGAVLLDRQAGLSVFPEPGDSYYDEETLYWLSHIIYAESGNQPLEGRLAVGNVVMNRVANPRFPATIKEVLFQKNQFSPASSGSIYKTPNEASVIAAKLVMDGAQVLETALFFNRAGMNSYAARHRTYVATIGVHAFYE